MTYDYLISLKKSDHRLADQVSQLLYIFAIAVFSFFLYQQPSKGIAYLIIITGITVIWVITFRNKKKKGQAYFRLGLLLAAAGWLIAPQRNIFMAILYALAGLLEKQVKFPPEIGFSENKIVFNTFPKKTLSWVDVSNVIIKDGLITIDKKNNKLYQAEIDGYVTKDVENEFNEFCRRNMESASAIQTIV